MEFVIRKNATLPLLKMQVVKDGRGSHEDFMRFIETSTIYFSMRNITTGVIKINSAIAGFVEKEFIEPNSSPEYYLYYRFTKKDTNKPGRYEGQFMLKNDSGTLILPVREKLNILIEDSLLEDELDYNECYVGQYQCCIISPTNIDLFLIAYYNPGSINVRYELSSNIHVPKKVEVNFTNILGVYSGSPIVITTGLTINEGYNFSYLEVLLNEDFNNLTFQSVFSGVTVTGAGIRNPNFKISENPIFPTSTPSVTPTNTITPSPTKTSTQTPTPTPTNPCVEYLTDEFGNFILTENGDYIISEFNPCIPPTPTPTPTNPCVQYLTDEFGNLLITESGDFIISEINPCVTPTPTSTITPTTSVTPTSTPAISLTPSTTPSVTQTLTPSPSQESLYPLTLYVQPLSGGQSIIFDGVTYTAETTVNITLNTFYSIEAVPTPGYLFTGWNIFGGSFSSTGQNTTVAISLTSGANLAPSYIEDPNYDALEAQLTTSLASYQNASDNDWVSITQEEYNNIFNNVDGVEKIGNTDEQVNTRDLATGYNTTTFGTIDVDTPLTIPTGYYVVGFVAESWNQNGQVQIGYTNTYHTGAPTYMGNSPNVIGGMTMFYVRKRPGNVEGAPASSNLYPVLNFLSPAYPNAVPNTFGWITNDGGTTWEQTNPLFTTAKIQILLTNILSWPLPPLPSPTPTNTPSPTMTPTPTITSNCQRNIEVQTLYNGGTSINSNLLQLTETSETLQIRINDIITDFNGSTSFVGNLSSDGTYTYIYTGPGGGVAFSCQFPLTFSGPC